MSDFKHKKRSVFSPELGDWSLLIRNPWLDLDAALDVCASQGFAGEVPVRGERKLTKQEKRKSAIAIAEFDRKCGGRGIASGWKLPAKSLRWLAEQLGKTTRTVRRYCEAGLILGAYRTDGGHWRISSSLKTLKRVRSSIKAFERKNKQGWVRRHEAEQSAADEKTIAANVALDFASEAGIYGAQHAVMEMPLPEITKKAAKPATRSKTRLVTAAKRLANLEKLVTASAIAKELRISRATFYRLFSVRDIRVAIRAANELAIAPELADLQAPARIPGQSFDDAGDGLLS